MVTLRHVHLGSFFLYPEDVRILSLRKSGTLVKGLDARLRGKMGLSKGLRASGSKELEPISYSILFY